MSRNFHQPPAKKQKTVEVPDLFDDDWDEEVIDDCFRRATQEVAQPSDVTLLSSYSVFNAPANIITSTQNDDELKDKFKELEDKYAEKEGEASILRSNLQNLRASYQNDQEKKQLEWKEKLSMSEKDKKTIKSELEFKNFEIVNLKQQIAELTKLVNPDLNVQRTQFSQIKPTVYSPEQSNKERTSTEDCRIFINIQKSYPLQYFNISFQSKASEDNSLAGLDIFSGEFSGKMIYQNLIPLTRLSSDQLSSEVSNAVIYKAVWSSHQVLSNFYMHLQKVRKLEDSKVQNPYSKGLQTVSYLSSEILEFLQRIIPYNAHLNDSLLSAQLLHSTACVRGETQSPILVVLRNIVTVIGQLGKEKDCNLFLFSLLKFLSTLYSSEHPTELKKDMVYEIAKEIISLNMDLELISNVNRFLNVVTRDSPPNFFLCSKEDNVDKGLKEESCRFTRYITALDKMVMKMENPNEFLSFSESTLNLTYNVFQFDTVQQQETKSCNCVVKLYKLAVGMIYKDLGTYDPSIDKQKTILKKRLKMLSLVIFNAYDLTQKYVTDFAHFKWIMYTFRHADTGGVNLKNLEKLSASEDFPVIPKEKFSDICL